MRLYGVCMVILFVAVVLMSALSCSSNMELTLTHRTCPVVRRFTWQLELGKLGLIKRVSVFQVTGDPV